MKTEFGIVRLVAVLTLLLFVSLGSLAFAEQGKEQEEEEDTEPPTVMVFEPKPTTDRAAVVIRARIHDPSGIDSVTFWMKEPLEREYRAVMMRRSRDGSYLTWFPAKDGNRRISYYIEAWDRAGNGPGLSGTGSEPHRMRIKDTMRGEKKSPMTYAMAALALLLLNWMLLRFMWRQDLRDRQRTFWGKLLRPLVSKNGHDLVCAVDRIVTWARNRMPFGRHWGREDVLRKLNDVREDCRPGLGNWAQRLATTDPRTRRPAGGRVISLDRARSRSAKRPSAKRPSAPIDGRAVRLAQAKAARERFIATRRRGA